MKQWYVLYVSLYSYSYGPINFAIWVYIVDLVNNCINKVSWYAKYTQEEESFHSWWHFDIYNHISELRTQNWDMIY